MSHTKDGLKQTFLQDHKRVSRKLTQLIEALRHAEDSRAVELADELDRLAGPHIEFEEALLYPLVAACEGQAFLRGLLDEHEQVRTTLAEIRTSATAVPFGDTQRFEWLRKLGTGISHLATCGRLLSHLTAMFPADLDRAARSLQSMRERGRLWTELPSVGSG